MLRTIQKLLLAFLFAAVLLSQTGGDNTHTIPTCRGAECRDDVTGYDHEGSPRWCQNYDGGGYKKNCSCKRACDEHAAGADCQTYCRSKRCRCDHGCMGTN